MTLAVRWFWLTLIVLFAGYSFAQAQQVDPTALVRRASQNELKPSDKSHPVRFKLRKDDDGKVTTKEIIQTRDGDVARLIARQDAPLTADARKNELARLNDLLNDPARQEHRRKREQEDSDRADEMVKLLPDAFIYTFAGMVPGPSGPCFRLTFVPNPKFTPPDREAEVYHGMAGELWVDQAQERLARLDAHLISDVDFGWGIVGRLYKGGTIEVQNVDVGEHHWETTHLKLNITGKILLIKSLSIRTEESSYDFRPVQPQMGYQQAIHMLLDDASADSVAQR